MAELLVLADDFSGALDTGAQFAARSMPTLVSTRIETLDQGRDREISVIALDLETRHTAPPEAAARVRRAVERARRVGIGSFYKKTDSTLRGNIGSEVGALLEAAGVSLLPFVPAYPAAGRTTVGGHHYVDGVPLHLSAYAADPQDPIRRSYVPAIIADQCPVGVGVVESSADPGSLFIPRKGKRILVFDAESESDLRRIAEQLGRLGLLGVTAGCAGFAEELAGALRSNRSPIERTPCEKPPCPARLLLVCGSTNPVSLEQIETAVRNGMQRVVLEPEQVFCPSECPEEGRGGRSVPARIRRVLSGGGDLILQTARGPEDLQRFHRYARSLGIEAAMVPRLVTEGLAGLACTILESCDELTPIVFGGDTVRGIVMRMGEPELTPVSRILPGIVHSRGIGDHSELHLISKAGGFGAHDAIQAIRRYLR